MEITYVLKSGSGRPVYCADDLHIAKQHMDTARQRKVNLRLFQVTRIEKELTNV